MASNRDDVLFGDGCGTFDSEQARRILSALLPKTFTASGPKRPLAIAVKGELACLNASLLGFTAAEVCQLVNAYCNSASYWRALRAGAPRIDINGRPFGVVTERHARDARRKLDALSRSQSK